MVEVFELLFKSPLPFTLDIQWSNQSIKLLQGKVEHHHNLRKDYKGKCVPVSIPPPGKSNSPTLKNLNSQQIFFHHDGKTNIYYNLGPFPMDWCVLLFSLFPVQDILSAMHRHTRNTSLTNISKRYSCWVTICTVQIADHEAISTDI